MPQRCFRGMRKHRVCDYDMTNFEDCMRFAHEQLAVQSPRVVATSFVRMLEMWFADIRFYFSTVRQKECVESL